MPSHRSLPLLAALFLSPMVLHAQISKEQKIKAVERICQQRASLGQAIHLPAGGGIAFDFAAGGKQTFAIATDTAQLGKPDPKTQVRCTVGADGRTTVEAPDSAAATPAAGTKPAAQPGDTSATQADTADTQP